MKLSFRQHQVLEHVAAGTPFANCNKQCDYGGRTTSLWSLKRRGLIAVNTTEVWSLTEAGKKVLTMVGTKSITLR